jgi:hypothetical protein
MLLWLQERRGYLRCHPIPEVVQSSIGFQPVVGKVSLHRQTQLTGKDAHATFGPIDIQRFARSGASGKIGSW